MPMKSYATFDEWAADQSKANQSLIRTMRAFIRKAAPDLQETVKWGNGCFVGEVQPVIYLYADEDHLQFGFFFGAALKDPGQRLEGKGKFVRAVKLRKPADIDKAYFTKLIQDALRLESKEGLASLNKSKGSDAFLESLSKPAIRALKAAGITSLKKLSRYSEKEILALHGIGPAAIPILRAALKKDGLLFKSIEKATKVAKPTRAKKIPK
ncbi:MAG TPA: DUF1801 domain-containing protein [Oligoflexus sp.]|nr:DUF1801 domain-containing protein [Oligoflexus sp.]HYX35627.1 DUF1801 domain-containing protein [Oligoflexus sp.]